jgi:NADPH-dependent 2,4-dienoyl-CoA reductase/sulfur reductase-like enzyme
MADYVIIGGSVAGVAAAKAIRAHDPHGELAVISAELHPPYSRVLLTHYIAGHLALEDLYYEGLGFWQQIRSCFRPGVRALAVNPEKKEVQLDSGQILLFNKLLVATGGRPSFSRHLPTGIRGITGLRTIEDASFIREQALAGARMVVLGGGPVGVKVACALREAGAHPVMIVSSPHVLSQAADDESALLVQRQMAAHGVSIRCGVDVAQVVSDAGGCRSLVLSNGQELPCQVLIVCKGVRPNGDILAKGLLASEGIRVDDKMQAGLPGIYAAGDVALTRDIIDGEHRISAIWPHAVIQGRVAGLNMAGQQTQYKGSLSRNAMEVFGLPFISMGTVRVLARPEWETKIISCRQNYRKLVYHQGRLIGAVLVGDQVEEAGRLQAAIRKAAIRWWLEEDEVKNACSFRRDGN